jgi:Tol biopolymer transport system component
MNCFFKQHGSHTMLTVQLLAAFFVCFSVINIVQGKESRQVAEQDKESEEATQLIVMISGQLAGAPTSGAGIIVAYEDGRLYIATANHVVRRGPFSAESLHVQLRSQPGNQVAAQLLPHVDRDLDLAVLRVDMQAIPLRTIPFRQLGEATALNRGDAVYHVGYPEGRPWRTNVTPDRFAERAGDALYFESSSVRPGDSGGGLFNARWELVGMVRADAPPEGAAIRMERIVEKLEQWGYPVSLGHTLHVGTRILFMSSRDGSDEVYVMNIDGTHQKRLSNNQTGVYADPAANDLPVWSPDGIKIAFVSDRDENREVYVMHADGTNQLNLTHNPADDISPVWSPDGTQIAFVSNRDGNPEIYVMHADGTNQLNLTHNPAYDGSPSWSPDGSRIAFVSARKTDQLSSTGTDIYLMNADGTNPVNLTNNPAADSSPVWSPDGTQIAFESNRDDNPEIYVMNADGTNPLNLSKHQENDALPAWSPDGARIAFVSSRDQDYVADNYINFEIYVVYTHGMNLVRLTNTPANDRQALDWAPSWSPDGKKLVFQSSRDSNDEIYVMDADGSNQIRLTQDPANDHLSSWSPFLKK